MKKIPTFKTEAEEQVFWATHDSTEYVDWSTAKRAVFPNLKPSTRTISLRLPQAMLEELKLLANKRDVPYQSLLKIFLSERIEAEFQRHDGKIEEDILTEVDRLVRQHVFPNRSRAIQEAVGEKVRRLAVNRLARECVKLDPKAEQALAEDGMSGEAASWPEY